MSGVFASLDQLDGSFVAFRFGDIFYAVDVVKASDNVVIFSEVVGQACYDGVISILFSTANSLLTKLDLFGIAQIINNLVLLSQKNFLINFMLVGLALHG